MITALLVNLDRSQDRLQFQQQQLAERGVPFERLPAVDAQQLPAAEYESLAYDWERKMSRAEVACFLSHYRAWEKVAADNRPYLVLEDDVLLSSHTAGLLAQFAHYQGEVQHISLETRNRKKLLGKKAVPVTDCFSLRRLYQDRTGAAAYILFPAGARLLLKEKEQRGAALADAFLCRSYGLKSEQVIPAAAVQSDRSEVYGLRVPQVFASTISSAFSDGSSANCHEKCDEENIGSLFLRTRFKFRRITAQLRMGMRCLWCLRGAQRCRVDVDTTGFDKVRS